LRERATEPIAWVRPRRQAPFVALYREPTSPPK